MCMTLSNYNSKKGMKVFQLKSMNVRVIQAFRVCQFIHVSVFAFHGDPTAIAHQIPTEPCALVPGIRTHYQNGLVSYPDLSSSSYWNFFHPCSYSHSSVRSFVRSFIHPFRYP